MGGLDARSALCRFPDLAARVATLVTIGTPHRGSPVADAIANRTDPLFAHIPPFLLALFEKYAGAVDDLTTAAGARFDRELPDVAGVRYIEVIGNAALGGNELFLFELAAAISGLKGEVNDGVVTRASALRDGHEHLDDWPVDHAGEIGWSRVTPFPVEIEVPWLRPPPHFARYDAIVEML
jgi:triacylglycerol lipase